MRIHILFLAAVIIAGAATALARAEFLLLAEHITASTATIHLKNGRKLRVNLRRIKSPAGLLAFKVTDLNGSDIDRIQFSRFAARPCNVKVRLHSTYAYCRTIGLPSKIK